MKLYSFEQELSRNGLKPVYIISGSEKFFVDRAIKKLRDYIENKFDEESLDTESFDAQEKKSDEIIGHASTYPFFSSKKFITVRNFDLTSKDEMKLYESYFEDPPEFTILVLIAERIDKRTKIIKVADKSGYLYEFDKPREYEVPDIVRQELKSRFNKIIDEDGVQLLSELIGTNLSNLSSELEKLILYVGDKKNRITGQDVATMVGNVAIVDNFKMVDLLAQKDGRQSVYMLMQVLGKHQERPERLIGLLKWHFARLYSAKRVVAQGDSIDTFFLKNNIRYSNHQRKFRIQLDKFTVQQLSKIYNLLYQADRKMKSTSLKPEFILERLFFKIVS